MISGYHHSQDKAICSRLSQKHMPKQRLVSSSKKDGTHAQRTCAKSVIKIKFYPFLKLQNIRTYWTLLSGFLFSLFMKFSCLHSRSAVHPPVIKALKTILWTIPSVVAPNYDLDFWSTFLSTKSTHDTVAEITNNYTCFNFTGLFSWMWFLYAVGAQFFVVHRSWKKNILILKWT